MTTQRGLTYIPVFLATLDHPDLSAATGDLGLSPDGKLRVANFAHTFRSRGQDYLRGYFKVSPPPQDNPRGALSLTIDNVDQRVSSALRAITSPADLDLEMVYAHAPDVVERRFLNLKLRSANWNRSELTGQFGSPNTEGRFMGMTIGPATHPGAFS